MNQTANILNFLIALTSEFGKRFSLSNQQAYAYLHRFGAVDVIVKNYDIAHTLSFDDNIEMLTTYCQRAGGELGV